MIVSNRRYEITFHGDLPPCLISYFSLTQLPSIYFGNNRSLTRRDKVQGLCTISIDASGCESYYSHERSYIKSHKGVAFLILYLVSK